jgi:hypothetical protein
MKPVEVSCVPLWLSVHFTVAALSLPMPIM